MQCPYCNSPILFDCDEAGGEADYANCSGCGASFSLLLNEEFCPDCGREFTSADTYCIQCGHIRNNFKKKGGY